MIDLNQKINEPELEGLVDKCQNITSKGKEFPKQQWFYMIKTLMHPKLNVPNGQKEQLKIEKILANTTF